MTSPQTYDGAEIITCPKGHKFMGFDAVWAVDHAATRETPEEGHFVCPGCGAELEE